MSSSSKPTPKMLHEAANILETEPYMRYGIATWLREIADERSEEISQFEYVTKDDEEVRITSETGGAKGQKLAQLGAIDPLAILEMARVAGHGAEKYDRYNFLRGYDWSLSFDAMQRHALAFWSGENVDPESGELHMAHAAWHCLAMVSFLIRDVGTDNRPPEA